MRLPTQNPSPFLLDPKRPVVEVAFGADGYAVTREALGRVELKCASGARVLVKPNAGRVARPGTGTNTSPEVVAAVVDALREVGAKVSVGDSPIAGVGPREALEASGIADVVRARGVPLLDLDERPSVVVELKTGRAIDRLKVCADVFEQDLVVSVPVVKTHMHTGVTLSVKNMKGCLWRRSKVTLHMLPPVEAMADKPLDIAICDLSQVLRPHLSVIDGTVGMQGLGPSAGTTRQLGAVVVSGDGFAADSVACALMGRQAEAIAHLRLGAEAGLGVIALEQLDVRPGDYLEHAQIFDAVPQDIALNFPGVQVLDENSCSACQSTLLLFLKRYGGIVGDYFPKGEPVRIAIGKGHQQIAPGSLCLGNCTAAHRADSLFVAGCPPVVSAIHALLTSGSNKDEGHR